MPRHNNKVQPTRQRQQGVATRSVRAGVAYNGANFVAQHEPSAKKNAAKSSASRKAVKKT